MSKALTVLAECVDIRNGKRFARSDVFDPVPTAEQAKRLVKAGCLPEAAIEVAIATEAGGEGLRGDGPTIAEYVAAGYLASNYPPKGYASRSTPEEIEEAVATEKAKTAVDAAASRAELEKLTNKQLQELAAAESIAIESDDNKAGLVDKIIAGRAAKA